MELVRLSLVRVLMGVHKNIDGEFCLFGEFFFKDLCCIFGFELSLVSKLGGLIYEFS